MGNEEQEHHVLSGVRCPSCRGAYSLVKFLGRKGDLYKVLVHCHACDTYGVGTARISEHSASFTPPAALRPPAPVSADDVLDIYIFLKDFDGDFRRLFGRGPVSKNVVE
ncbi:MAG: hypothetical protein HYY30_11925 [Chloroflexi bacterium]|nr:hypothetical protein [Chloroflexota bacterium]